MRVFFVSWLVCPVCILLLLAAPPWVHGAPAKSSDDAPAAKPVTPRKKKPAATSTDDAPPAAPSPKPATDPAPDSSGTKKKRPAADSDASASPSNPDQPHHAPAATIEAEQLADFAAQPASIQAMIRAALELTKLNLTYTFGSAEPSAGGMDCSGTIYYLLRSQGLKDVPRDSSEQYIWARKHGQFFAVISTEADSFEFKDLAPGDLMFWSGTYKTERAVPISHVMLYLGREKGSGKRVMFGSSDGRSYNGVQRWGVSVFDFKMPKANPADPEKHVDFVGYAHIPALRDLPPMAAAPVNAHPASDKALPRPTTPAPIPATPVPAPATPAPAADTSSASPKLTAFNMAAPASPLHEPERGSAERKAIMDALRADRFSTQAKSVIFQVNYLKVHSGWAWADVTPQDHNGTTVESRTKALLHLDEGHWKAVDLGKLPVEGDKPINAEFIKSLAEVMPGVPVDIFPKRRE